MNPKDMDVLTPGCHSINKVHKWCSEVQTVRSVTFLIKKTRSFHDTTNNLLN